MILKTFSIDNFRGIVHLELDLDRTTVLIGENNVGKTSVLEALQICMTRGLNRRAVPFSQYDLHLSTDGSEQADAPPIALTLTFEETQIGEWSDEILQAFSNVVQSLLDGRQRLVFRVSGQYDKTTNDLQVDWSFLDQAGNPLPTARNPTLVSELQQLTPVFLLTAVRDASHHFQTRSALWGPFTRNPQISEDKRREIETQVEQLNQSVLDGHKPFEAVKDRLAEIGKLMPLAGKDLISIEAVPTRILDILARTQVKLASRTGIRLPLDQHGAGTQSLLVLFLFQAFLQSRLADAYDANSEPILALEEPESHLHPSAIRALWSTLHGLAGQKIISTHSGDLLAAAPLDTVRRLAWRNGRIEVFQVGAGILDQDETRKVAYHIRAKRGALLFARCWLLVEGETEFTLIPELARAMSLDLDLIGISCVEFSQCGLKPLIKTARALGIEWHVLTDNDQQGLRYEATAISLLGPDPAAGRITKLVEPDVEHTLWDGGYQAIYEAAVDTQHKFMIAAVAGTADYARQTIDAAVKSTSKPHLAYAVALQAAQSGSPGVPQSLRSAIEAAVSLAAQAS